jgi:site-specific recombinase XerD
MFTTPKTSRSVRTLPIVSALAPLVVKHGKGFLFPSSRSTSSVIGETSVRRLCAFYSDKAGLESIKLHEFRHSCASNLLRAGIPVRVVARWLGDTESVVSDTYSHLFRDEKDIIRDFYDAPGKML